MAAPNYQERRSQIETYFDRTAAEAWSRLTSTEPVGRIRATVRAGRQEMLETLLYWLPRNLEGKRLLDAGCGTGLLAVEAARRGADVVAVDLSPTLIELARERTEFEGRGRIEFRVADMLDPGLGRFDYAIAMDSLIHYAHDDIVEMAAALTSRAADRVLFTHAPRTLPLAVMHTLGRLFPRSDRAPDLEPIAEERLREMLAAHPALASWRAGRSHCVATGFYISNAIELVKVG